MNAAVQVIDSLAREAHRVNVNNGWWEQRLATLAVCSKSSINHDPSLTIELLGLVTSEVAEAMEAARKHPKELWGDERTKDTLVRELGGAIVRIMDLAAFYELPLGQAIINEINANRDRGYKHGGKAA